MSMTPADLRQRVAAATAGKWDCSTDALVAAFTEGDEHPYLVATCDRWENAALIALTPDFTDALAEAWEALENAPCDWGGLCANPSAEMLARPGPLLCVRCAALAKLEGLGA